MVWVGVCVQVIAVWVGVCVHCAGYCGLGRNLCAG